MSLELPAEQTALLRSDLFGGLAGALRDLRRPDRLRDPVATAEEGAVYSRLLEALDRGEIGLPDEEAWQEVARMAASFDAASGFGSIAATHEAHRALLDVLGGPTRERGCPR